MKPPKKIHKCSRHLNNAPGGIHIRGVCCQVCGPGVLERSVGWAGDGLAIRWVGIVLTRGDVFSKKETVSPFHYHFNPFFS